MRAGVPLPEDSRHPRQLRGLWRYAADYGAASDAYSPSGGQGQYVMIIPSHKAVIVRRGFDAGAGFRIERFCADVIAAID